MRPQVVVLGGGPAGLATAIGLARSSVETVVLTRARGGWGPVGECLASSSKPLLMELGAWDGFQQDGHLPSFGNVSVWGGSTPMLRSSIYDVNGHGWHIDRKAFEERLSRVAADAGVRLALISGQVDAQRDGSGWTIEAPGFMGRLRSRFLIDATGRASWLGRRMGRRRERDGRQVALVAFFDGRSDEEVDSTTLVEAVENGWWYSAALPSGRLVASFTTDPDLLPTRPEWQLAWSEALRQAPYTGRRIAQATYRRSGPLRLVPAAGGRLIEPAGPGWLAVGDAAMCYDPLAGHGLTAALAGARDVVRAIKLGGPDAPAGPEYVERLELAYTLYAAERQSMLNAEGRWPQSPFWQRRHSGR